jgi:hypothetical protein
MEIVVIWARGGMQETPEEMAEIMLEIFFKENFLSKKGEVL